MLTAVIGVMAMVTGLARAWPQAFRIVTQPDTSGVSSLTWMLLLCASIAWTAIGVVEHITVTIVFGILGGIGVAAVLAALVVRRHVGTWPPIAATVITVAACVATYELVGVVGVSVLGVGISVVMFIPQAVTAVRHSTNGVSVSSWIFALATSLLWMLYGLLIDKFVLVAPSLVTVPAAAVILWKTISRRQIVLARSDDKAGDFGPNVSPG